MDRSAKQNINRDNVALNNILDQMNLTDIYRNLHPKKLYIYIYIYIYFKAHKEFSKIDSMVGHKRGLKNTRKLKSHQVFSRTTMA